jgi:hypothetical protein
MFGREITIHTVIYGVYIRFWPTLRAYRHFQALTHTFNHTHTNTHTYTQAYSNAKNNTQHSQVQVLARALGCSELLASHGQGRATRASRTLDHTPACTAAPTAQTSVPPHRHNAHARPCIQGACCDGCARGLGVNDNMWMVCHLDMISLSSKER